MKANKLEDGLTAFRKALHLLMVNALPSASQAQEAQQAIQQAAQYILAMEIELERRGIVGTATDISGLSEDKRKRALELSAYFTVPDIEAGHQTLALYTAMNFAYRNKQFGTVLTFANALIEKGTNPRFKEQAKKLKAVAERTPTDAIEIEFDTFGEFAICAASHTPIYAGEPSAQSSFSAAKYHARYKGTVCKIDQVTAVGAPSSGLRLTV